MPIPTYDKFIEPILRYLASHPEGAPAKDAHDASAVALNVSDLDRQELLPSGLQPIYKNRAGWAHDRLKRAGLSASPRRGYWQLTQDGSDFARTHPGPLSLAELDKLAMGFNDVRLNPRDGATQSDESIAAQATPSPSVASPDDRLSQALSELRITVATEIEETLASVSPAFFETVVLDVLHRMGYGTSRSDLQRVGGSGDGGIDGIISLDKLGLEKVYVQAKRWQHTVGRPEVQGFYGALAGQRATKGVFITTSAFTAQAVEFARSVERVVLVDGRRLADLMIEYEVGVTARAMRDYAANRGWTIAMQVKEVGSGAKAREQRQQLLDSARRREIDVVLVWRLDRWGRSLLDLVTTLQELIDLKIGFVSLSEALDLTTSTGRAMAGMLSVFAAFEHDILRERVRAGLDHARQSGTRLGRPATASIKAAEVRKLFRQGISKSEISRRLDSAEPPYAAY